MSDSRVSLTFRGRSAQGVGREKPRLASREDIERFHRDYFLPLVLRVTWKHGISKEDAKDLVQEAFLIALDKVRIDGNPRAWLTSVVDNLAANHLRKQKRRAALLAKWSPLAGTALEGEAEPSHLRSGGKVEHEG